MPQEVQARQSAADEQHQHLAARIETLVQEIATFPDPHARAVAGELVQALLEMYGEGLARLLEITAGSEASGIALIDTFASDELLSSLFVLHGLHPLDIETRILQALDAMRPSLKSQGGSVEFVRLENGIAYLRLSENQSGCHSCSGPTTLKLVIEEAIFKAVPDLNGLEIEGASNPPPRSAMPITFVPRRHKDSVPG
ncbi:MAG TPA: NifU family protein [Ktedonobacteraceae bacterium]|nr:NifU family protein [Ktedonobacteraceae bacterium]